MRKLFLLLTLIPIISYGQENFLKEYNYADSLVQSNQIDSGYLKLKELETKIPDSDTLYDYTLWYLTEIVTHLESLSRSSEDFQSSLDYGLEGLELIKKGIKRFDIEFAKRKPFMIKNVVVSYFGLGNYAKGQEYKDLLYKAYKDKKLPEGLDEYFNFDFFTLDDKNIWGYEWFAELPKNRFSSSFTKVVYYVYSTNPDGSDKDQLYRLHVLMFHGDNEHFDYVMDKRLETATDEVSGTLYSYTYKEDIDYEKLHNDVIQIVKGNLQPDTRRTTSKKKNKDGQIEVDVELNNE
jgi:hypothetical protein